jgi:hypothetical protein
MPVLLEYGTSAMKERMAEFSIRDLHYTIRRDSEGVYYFRQGAEQEWTRGIPPGIRQSELDRTFADLDRKRST